MQGQRYNVFNQIHKGLRGMLYDTAIRLQQTAFTSSEANVTVDQLEQVLHFFDEHADNEDHFILPHIRKHDAQLIDELEKDHDVDHQLTQTLFDNIQEWRLTADVAQKESIGKRILLAFNEFIAFNLYHMNKEETVLIDLLWKHYTDGEILQMEEQIIHAIPIQTLLAESRWMMRSINDTEVIGWLSGVKQGAPPEVFNTFLQMANEELPANRLTKVEAALSLV
ncbi:hemerythrin domain-containing protein [Spirosoma sp. BT702]|uniref:Hemerythrin domain-containing protein n=1 Tax=Spirosoma profusum TaxID=2771354 RepID=A0A926XYK3_9BACT|nr:hemerythrin domain-containing protein [Spirosoma profusum]MBD2700203.1 hemerythrin domain-containing protein [Spirosoma profusum]